MKWIEKIMDIVMVLSVVVLLLFAAAIFVLSIIGLIKMAECLVLPWLRGTLL